MREDESTSAVEGVEDIVRLVRDWLERFAESSPT
jgi:hypothetical protein